MRDSRLPEIPTWTEEMPLAGVRRMVLSSLSQPSIKGLMVCAGFDRAFPGPCSIVWEEKAPIPGRALKRTVELMPGASMQRTRSGHFLLEKEPGAIAVAIREGYENRKVLP